jgi:hypothetical protein
MRQLILISIEVRDIETIPLTNNWSMARGKIGKTGYPLQYVEHDLHDLQDALAELALRLDVKEYREIGLPAPGRMLRWLAEGVVARAEAILSALTDPAELSDHHPTPADDKFPFSPRLAPLKSALLKLDPSSAPKRRPPLPPPPSLTGRSGRKDE